MNSGKPQIKLLWIYFFLWLKGFHSWTLKPSNMKCERRLSIAQILYTVNNSENVFFLQFPALKQVPRHLHALSHFQKKIFLAMWLLKRKCVQVETADRELKV